MMSIFGSSGLSPEDARREAFVKIQITDNLKQALKALQQQYVESDQPIYSEDCANAVCNILEAALLHGLKSKCFWTMLTNVTHKDVLAQLNHLAQITTEVGMCRAWIRLALNDGILESYLDAMLSDQQLMRKHYKNTAYLRDREQSDILKSYIKGLSTFAFKLSYNSSVLNIWTNTPLILAGRAVPSGIAQRPPVTSRSVPNTSPDGALSQHSHSTPAPQVAPPLAFSQSTSVTPRTAVTKKASTALIAPSISYGDNLSGAVPRTPPNTPYEAQLTSTDIEQMRRLALSNPGSNGSGSSVISHPDPVDARDYPPSMPDYSILGLPSFGAASAGSSFGGTSAGGLPSLAHAIDDLGNNNKTAENLSVSSASMAEEFEGEIRPMKKGARRKRRKKKHSVVIPILAQQECESESSSVCACICEDLGPPHLPSNLSVSRSDSPDVSSLASVGVDVVSSVDITVQGVDQKTLKYTPDNSAIEGLSDIMSERKQDVDNNENKEAADSEKSDKSKISEIPNSLPVAGDDITSVQTEESVLLTPSQSVLGVRETVNDKNSCEPIIDVEHIGESNNPTVADFFPKLPSSHDSDNDIKQESNCEDNVDAAEVMPGVEEGNSESKTHKVNKSLVSSASSNSLDLSPYSVRKKSLALEPELSSAMLVCEKIEVAREDILNSGHHGNNGDNEAEECGFFRNESHYSIPDMDEAEISALLRQRKGNSLGNMQGWSSDFEFGQREKRQGVYSDAPPPELNGHDTSLPEISRDQRSYSSVNESFGNMLSNYGSSTGPVEAPSISQVLDSLPDIPGSPPVSMTTRPTTLPHRDVLTSSSSMTKSSVESPTEALIKAEYDTIPDSPRSSLIADTIWSSLLDTVGELSLEKGLDSQNYKCKGCARPVGMFYGAARVCSLDAGYYCYECHENDIYYIPAHILFNWDFRKKKVCKQSLEFLHETEEQPLLNVQSSNPKLYDHVPTLNTVKELRCQLRYLKSYLFTCNQAVADDLRQKVWPREYLYEDLHLYALTDLLQVPGGQLAHLLSRVTQCAAKHVYSCALCSQKGYICEVCNNPKVIYPFEMDSTCRCQQCRAVFHKECRPSTKACPKCIRLQRRHAVTNDDTAGYAYMPSTHTVLA